MKALRPIAILTGICLLAGCGPQQSSTPPSTPATPTPESASLAGSATITGKVLFKGTPPKMPTITFTADATCAAMHPTPVPSDTVIVTADGTLQNVFVYVKGGKELRSATPPKTPVLLDQKGCMYRPHVLGVQVGQPLEVANSDNTVHNVNATATLNRGFNRGQPVVGMKFQHKFTTPEVMIKFVCSVHPWMSAYVGVLDHPFFSVTGTNGAFSIGSLPSGTYSIEAWHEQYGTQQQSVTVGDKETKEISFEFQGPP